MTATEILFLLLRSGFGVDTDSLLPESLSTNDLAELYRISKAHDVAHIVANALQKRNLLGSDEPSAQFVNAQIVSVYRCEQLKYTFDEICNLFEEEEIPYLPLKGSVLRPYYPEEWMRTSCDIDILVHESDMNRAVNALVEKRGYKTDRRRTYHDMSLFSQNGIHLELHFNIKENTENIDRMLSDAWSYSIKKEETSFCYRFTDEFFVFHHIAHMSYHFVAGGCGIRPFLDLFVIQSKMTYDSSLVREYCARCEIEEFYNNVLNQLNVWFGDGTHTSLSQRIEKYVLIGGVYGNVENRITVAQGKRGGKINYIFSRIFVSYNTLKCYYPVLEKYKWLFPFMQVRRWFSFFLRGKFKRGIREIKVNQGIGKDRADSMREFLVDIGL